MKKKIIIIGAGLSGLSSAYHLQNKFDCVIYEKNPFTGGLCHSHQDDGYIFDYTGHLLHLKTDYAKELIQHLLGDNLVKKKRNSWIFSNNVYTRYPFQANTYGLSPKIIQECVFGFIEAKAKNKINKINFEKFVLSVFGKGIAKYFMFPYNRKMWTIPLSELTIEWMGEYVPQPSVEEVIRGALLDQKKEFGYNIYFQYPLLGGIQSLIDEFCKNFKGDIYLNSEVEKIDFKKKKLKVKNIWQDYDYIINTAPLKELVLKIIKNPPQDIKQAGESLRNNSVLNINFCVEKKNLEDKHWIYFPEDKFLFYRAGISTNFSPFLAPSGKSIIYTEIAYQKGAKNLEITPSLIEKVKQDLIAAGILNKKDKIIKVKVLNLPYAYVIYDKNRTPAVNLIQEFLKKNDIFSIGRYGNWEYSAMEEAILAGRDLSKELR